MHKKLLVSLLLSIVLNAHAQKATSKVTAPPAIVGLYEIVTINQHTEFPIKAKQDTGAALSSLSANNIIEFRKNGQQWLKFDVVLPHRVISIEAPKLRMAKIRFRDEEILHVKKQASEFQIRPVVGINLCLGQHLYHSEVNLSDRRKFLTPLLIGRNLLTALHLAVKPDVSFLLGPPNCLEKTK